MVKASAETVEARMRLTLGPRKHTILMLSECSLCAYVQEIMDVTVLPDGRLFLFYFGTGNFPAIRLPNQSPPVMFFPNDVCFSVVIIWRETIRASVSDDRTGELMSS